LSEAGAGRKSKARRPRRPYEKSLATAAIAAPFTFFDVFAGTAGFNLPFTPVVFMVQSVSLGIFTNCLFLTACFMAVSSSRRTVLFLCMLAAALVYPLMPLVLDLPSLFFPALYALLICFVCFGFVLRQVVKKREYRYFLAAAVQVLVVAVSLSFPVAELQIILRFISVTVMLIPWKALLDHNDEPEESPASEDPKDKLTEQLTEPEDLEELEAADETEVVTAVQRMNSFVPVEFLKLLKKESITDLKLGDHHKQEMTIFFSDIRQFTELFQSLSPEEGFKFINSYLTRIVPVIEQYGGFVDKYVGDAIMALFPQANGADMAVKASIEIQKRILDYNEHRAKSGYRPLETGIGIHTGTLILGVVGVHHRLQNTVISDAVNLASRVEGLTKAFGVSMAISGQTFQKLEHPENYMFRYLGNVRVKGKEEPIRVYEILDGIDKDILEKKMQTNRFFEQGLFSFVRKNYLDALENFTRVIEILPGDPAAEMYMEHCKYQLSET
jgi:two-component system sensor histidine kinase ChiS